MSSSPFTTEYLHDLVDRHRAGDRGAGDELIHAAASRMRKVVQWHLRHSPDLGRWIEEQDLLQNARIRLCHDLRAFQPHSTRHFYDFAAEMIKREVVEVARSLRGPHGLIATHESCSDLGAPTASECSAEELEQCARFHEAIKGLKDKRGEMFRLAFYHDLPAEVIAKMMDVDVDSVHRGIRRARTDLNRLIAQQIDADAVLRE